MSDDEQMSHDPVIVLVAFGRSEAVVVQSRLADAGIRSFLRYESLMNMYPVSVDGLGRVEVLVAAGDEVRAREIIGSPT